MINFTVGPVQSNEEVKKIGSENVPYFRTPEFSEVMLENERLFKEFAGAEKDARVVFLTGSGTAAMEAAVMNTFTEHDKVLVVNGGSFGKRFVELMEIYNIPFEQIVLAVGKKLTANDLKPFENMGFTGFAVNLNETSTGVLYDLPLISAFCERNHLFPMVDAISAFLADDINMRKMHIDVLITGSQKALACPPGVSIIALSPIALKRVETNRIKSMYLNLQSALKNGERGQTPFTPAVGTLLQIHARLKQIERDGGVPQEKKKIAELASYFRNGIKDLPLDICSESLSNAVTPLMTRNCSAKDIFSILKDEYQIWICPNGGELGERIFRVGHIGALKKEDYDVLLNALHELKERGILK